MEMDEFRALCTEVFTDVFQKAVPNPKTRYVKWYVNAYGNVQRGSTGNMAFNASKIRHNTKSSVIYVDPKIAPYVPYTNEEWISPMWKGHKNPNQGWFERAANRVRTWIANKLQGEVK